MRAIRTTEVEVHDRTGWRRIVSAVIFISFHQPFECPQSQTIVMMLHQSALLAPYIYNKMITRVFILKTLYIEFMTVYRFTLVG